MKKRYQVTITECAEETRLIPKAYQKLRDKPDISGDTYGYAGEVETRDIVKREVYRQDTDKLDLISVIKAVNGLNAG